MNKSFVKIADELRDDVALDASAHIVYHLINSGLLSEADRFAALRTSKKYVERAFSSVVDRKTRR